MTDVTLEGWIPEIGPGLSLAEVVDKAFDYRGNVTVVRADGSETEGYLFNRNADAAVPFVQMFDVSGEGPHTIAYRDIRTIRFTGRDTAARAIGHAADHGRAETALGGPLENRRRFHVAGKGARFDPEPRLLLRRGHDLVHRHERPGTT